MKLITLFANKTPFTSSIGLGRSLLALSTFCTLLFNDINELTYVNTLIFESNTNSGLQNISLFYLFSQENQWIAKTISMVILFAVIIGWRPRYTGLLHWWVAVSFMISNTVISGGDQIAANISLFMIPYTLLDSRKWHWVTNTNKDDPWLPYKNIMGNFILCLIVIQVSIIYFEAGIAKMSVPEWRNGTALYYWFNNGVFGVPEYLSWVIKPIISSEILLPIFTHGVMVFEVLLFAGILATKKVRRFLLKLGFLFHLGIIFIHGIFGFSIVMWGALVIYLAYDVELGVTKRIRRFAYKLNNAITQRFGK